MLENVSALERWGENTNPLRPDAVDEAAGAYFQALGMAECPSTSDVTAANSAARTRLTERLLTQEWVASINSDDSPVPEDRLSQLRLHFKSLRPELRVPAPVVFEELPPVRIGLAAIVGAISGMLILTPLARLLLNMEHVGTFVGAPTGAFLLVVAVWYSSRSKSLRLFLIGTLGVGAIGEVWAIFTGGGVFGTVWRKLGGRRSAIQRVLLYVAIILLVFITKGRKRYDRAEHDRIVRSAIDQWLSAAIPTLGVLMQPEIAIDVDVEGNDILWALAKQLLQLPRSPRNVPQDTLATAIEELFIRLGNLGFQVEPTQSFCWQPDHNDQFTVFGAVEPGDHVSVEEEPVVFRDVTYKKGQVRKVKRGN